MARLHPVSTLTRDYLREPAAVPDRVTSGSTRATRIACPSSIPATGQAIGSFLPAAKSDLHAAVAAARQSFDDGRWRRLTPARRQQLLWRVAGADRCVRRAVRGARMPRRRQALRVGAEHEVPHAAETFRYYAGWCTKLNGDLFDASVPGAEFHGYVRHEPVGVVGPDHPVERRAGGRGVEAGAGACRGLLGRAETRRAVDAVGAACSVRSCSRPASRPAPSTSSGQRAGARSAARGTPRRGQDRIHRIDSRRQAAAGGRTGQPEASVARAGRQVARRSSSPTQISTRRCRPRQRRSSPMPARCALLARGSMRSAASTNPCAPDWPRVASRRSRSGPDSTPIRSSGP